MAIRLPRVSIFAAMLLAISCPAVAQTRSFTMGGMAFSEADIIDARGIPDGSGNAALHVTLDTAAAQRLAKLTEAVDQELPIVLNGEIIASPVIREPILSGTFVIAGQFTLAEMDRLAKLISGKDPLPESLEDDAP